LDSDWVLFENGTKLKMPSEIISSLHNVKPSLIHDFYLRKLVPMSILSSYCMHNNNIQGPDS
jgi:hypothetical protein